MSTKICEDCGDELDRAIGVGIGHDAEQHPELYPYPVPSTRSIREYGPYKLDLFLLFYREGCVTRGALAAIVALLLLSVGVSLLYN